jgi:hypothetical protein
VTRMISATICFVLIASTAVGVGFLIAVVSVALSAALGQQLPQVGKPLPVGTYLWNPKTEELELQHLGTSPCLAEWFIQYEARRERDKMLVDAIDGGPRLNF